MAILTPVVGSNVDVKVKVSSNDTTAGYAAEKFFAGSGITLVQTNDGSNEGLYVHYTGASTSGLTALVDDTTPTLGGNLDGGGYVVTNLTLDDDSNVVHADEVHLSCRNESGGVISKGEAVYISGYNVGQDRPLINKARANSESTMPCLGLAEEDIANNAVGQVAIVGQIDGINTSAYNSGDSIYVSASVAGGITTTRPSAPNLVQPMGIVLRSHASLGRVKVVTTPNFADAGNLLKSDLSGSWYDLTNIGNIHASGYRGGYQSKSSNYSLDRYDYMVQFTAGGVTGTLPNPSTVGAGTEFIIKSNTTGIVTVNSSSGMIDNYSTVSLAQYDTLKVMSTGSDYLVI